ncbi:hypothetical protein O181_114358, partial [Austropuccinia psidii MF-1]|nr:hypothetical protein [Austropuccinia psidii MF-1]
MQKEQPDLRHYGEIPHPLNARVLRNYVVELTHVSWRYGMKVLKNSPNNLVYIKKGDSDIEFGKVCHILDLGDSGLHNGPLLT